MVASAFLTGSGSSSSPELVAYTRADRDEQTRYAYETINLDYKAFIARKRDFTNAGCRIEDYENNGFAYPGCRKPSPYNAFNWTDDGCSGREQFGIVGRVVSNVYRDLFNEPCQLHDFGYRNFGKGLTLGRMESVRETIDNRFHAEMYRLCSDRYGNILQRYACEANADNVWIAVRAKGGDWNTPAETPLAPLAPDQPVGGSTPPAGSSSSNAVTNNPSSLGNCTFTDAGNAARIDVPRGATFSDSRGIAYRADNNCGLAELPKPACSYSDAGNGKPI
ncbi:phospholipase A2, partial [Pseudonocardia oroxyli]